MKNYDLEIIKELAPTFGVGLRFEYGTLEVFGELKTDVFAVTEEQLGAFEKFMVLINESIKNDILHVFVCEDESYNGNKLLEVSYR